MRTNMHTYIMLAFRHRVPPRSLAPYLHCTCMWNWFPHHMRVDVRVSIYLSIYLSIY